MMVVGSGGGGDDDSGGRSCRLLVDFRSSPPRDYRGDDSTAELKRTRTGTRVVVGLNTEREIIRVPSGLLRLR